MRARAANGKGEKGGGGVRAGLRRWNGPRRGRETRGDAGPSAKKWAAQWRKGKTGHGKGRRSRPA